MSKDKLKKFEENESFDNLLQVHWEEIKNKDFRLKGKWSTHFFENNNSLNLELACGKGEYTNYLANKYPHKNFLGIDIKGARLWKGCKSAIDNDLKNAGFLRTKIENLDKLFAKNEVSNIWIIFPDPQPKKRKRKKRLTSDFFLLKYKEILNKNGHIHLKTDDANLYEFTLEEIKKYDCMVKSKSTDVYNDIPTNEIAAITTFYEKIWLKENRKIHYIKFCFGNE